ncbi:MAG: hypothetical protein AB1733_12870 [Thermodesulfobacteriota bacterium]
MKISDQKRKQISRLIAEGESLDPLDLEVFYRWTHDSYEALGFNPLQQHRFDEYCRSSHDSNFMRVYIGVWMLRLALAESSPDSKDCQDRISSSDNVLYLAAKGGTGSGRKG